MENQVNRPPIQLGNPHTRRRVRVKRKLTRWEKLGQAIEMPGLRRRERNQRLALVGVLVAFLLYIAVIRPLVDWLTPPVTKGKQTSIPIPTKTPGLGRGR